jgi:tRNA threonylcarbamoyladenosine biosynthesis protein TsaB
VLGVSTLDAIAEESGVARVVVCLDARMREVYYACLERAGDEWRTASPRFASLPQRRSVRRGAAGADVETASRHTLN